MTVLFVVGLIALVLVVVLVVLLGATRGRQDQAKVTAVVDQNETVRILAAIKEASSTTDRTIKDQLTLIHTLVNSNLSASLRGELAAMVKEEQSVREVMRLNTEAGREPTQEVKLHLTALSASIAEKRAALNDRLEATEKAEQAIE